MQPLETVESIKLAGQTCQLKLNLKAGANFSATSSLVTIKVTYGTGTDQAAPASTWTGTTDALSTTQAITTTATDYTFDSISIPSSATQVQVYVSFTPTGTASTNDWVEIAGAQLTAGKMAAWERLPIAQQLARCQRFCQVIDGSIAGSNGVLTGMFATTAIMIANYVHPVPMRIVPAVTTSSLSHWKPWDGVATAVVLSAIANTAGTTSMATLLLTTGTAPYAAGRGGVLTTVDAGARIYFNSRL